MKWKYVQPSAFSIFTFHCKEKKKLSTFFSYFETEKNKTKQNILFVVYSRHETSLCFGENKPPTFITQPK